VDRGVASEEHWTSALAATGALELPIELAAESCEMGSHAGAWPLRVHRLAQDHAISCYDASYLLLAQNRGVPVACDDTSLCRAARDE